MPPKNMTADVVTPSTHIDLDDDQRDLLRNRLFYLSCNSHALATFHCPTSRNLVQSGVFSHTIKTFWPPIQSPSVAYLILYCHISVAVVSFVSAYANLLPTHALEPTWNGCNASRLSSSNSGWSLSQHSGLNSDDRPQLVLVALLDAANMLTETPSSKNSPLTVAPFGGTMQ